MREIKFRGISIATGQWVYGSYHSAVGTAELYTHLYNGGYENKSVDLNAHWIFERSLPQDISWNERSTYIPHKVYPESVGQFTGIVDKNKKEIWEGDKVKRRVWLIEGQDYMDYNCTVRWNGWCYALFIHDKQVWGLDPINARECELIGSIHDQPVTK